MDLPFQNIPPEADVNVSQEVQVVSEDVPVPMKTLITDGCTSWEFSEGQVSILEQLTRGQSTSGVWLEQRIGRITASNIHSVLTKVRHLEQSAPKRLDCTSLLKKLCTSDGKNLDHVTAIKYGRAMEAEARRCYTDIARKDGHEHVNVSECGMFVMREKVYIGASPDALVKCSCCEEGLLEIKCPLTVAHVDPSVQPPPYITTESDCYVLKKEHPYYSQVIAQMGVTGRKWCDFFVYSKHGSITVHIPFDDSRWQALVKACDFFFEKYMIDFLKSC